jgi:hypothetical protein
MYLSYVHISFKINVPDTNNLPPPRKDQGSPPGDAPHSLGTSGLYTVSTQTIRISFTDQLAILSCFQKNAYYACINIFKFTIQSQKSYK